MSLFITQCPHCNTCFRTSISQLQSADGMVRCGACLRVFAADDNLLPTEDLRTIVAPMPEDSSEAELDEVEVQLSMDEFVEEQEQSTQDDEETDSVFTLDMADSLPNRISPHISTEEPFWQLIEEDPEQIASNEANSTEGLESLESNENIESQPTLVQIPTTTSPQSPPRIDADSRSPISAIDFDDENLNDDSGASSFTRFSAAEIESVRNSADPLELSWGAQGPKKRNQALLFFLSFVLCFSLAGQFVWFNKDSLSQNPTMRIALEQLCALASCQLPALVDLRAIRSDALVVRSHEEIANALSVNFQFHNDATFPQPFPDLSLRFTDADNSLVAQRRLAPSEYLPKEIAKLRMMPPSAPVQVRLDILDPGIRAINYEVRFYANSAL